MKTRNWIILMLCLLGAALAAALALRHLNSGQIANIYQDGICIRSVDLGHVDAPYRFTVTDSSGHENVIEVAPGQIRVAEANCPDQICVHTGWLSRGIRPIVCLPAKLTISLDRTAQRDDLDIDGIAG